MDLLGLAQFSAVFALGDGTTLLLDFIEGTVDVFACRRTVPFDARFAGPGRRIRRATNRSDSAGAHTMRIFYRQRKPGLGLEQSQGHRGR